MYIIYLSIYIHIYSSILIIYLSCFQWEHPFLGSNSITQKLLFFLVITRSNSSRILPLQILGCIRIISNYY